MDPHDENDHNTFRDIASSNLNKISKNIRNIGYTDGITDGREAVFQKGFDEGYSDGFFLSFELQKYQRAAEILFSSPKFEKYDDLRKELEDLIKLNPRDQTHFKMLENLDKPISEIRETQNIHTRQTLKNLADEFPLFYAVIENKGC